jgi:VanZ family protein
MATQRSPCRHPDGARLSRSALRWLAPLGWAALLLWLGRQRGEDLPESDLWRFPGGDKLVHAAFYGVLGALTAWAARYPRPGRAVLAGLAAAAMVGLLDEWGQASTAGRDASGADLAADLVGGTLGALGALCARPVARRFIPRRKG